VRTANGVSDSRLRVSESARCTVNGGKRLRGYCPHPRAPSALALSLDRERDLEMDTETEAKNSQTRRMTAKIWQYPAWSAVRFSQ